MTPVRPRHLPSRRRLVAVLGLALLASALVVGYTLATGPVRVTVTIHFSRYAPARMTVPHGRPVTFVIENTDPIDHEWILGNEALHAAHRTGTEAEHAGRPTEVTIPALELRSTTITFPGPTTLSYICHLPGHEAYGMTGTLVVE